MRRDRKMIVLGLAGVAALALGACHANNTANTGAETSAPAAANETAAAPTSGAPAENTTGATTSAPASSAPPSGQ